MSVDAALPLAEAIDRHRQAVAHVGGPAFQWSSERHPVGDVEVQSAATKAGWDLTDDALTWWTSTSWSPRYWEVYVGPAIKVPVLFEAVDLVKHLRTIITVEDGFEAAEWMPIAEIDCGVYVVDLGSARRGLPHLRFYYPENGTADVLVANLSALVQWWTDNVDRDYWRWDPDYRRDEIRGRWEMGPLPKEISETRYALL